MSFLDVFRRHDFGAERAAIAAKTPADVDRALARAGRDLDLDDLRALLSPAAAPRLEDMARLAHALTVRRFGRTMQLYAPLYLSNACVNVCTYCGYSADVHVRREILDDADVDAEGEALAAAGFEHVLLVTGESPRADVPYLEAALARLRPRFANLSLEVQPLEEAEYARLADAGASAVYVYQETYDEAAYRATHLEGPKADMARRLDTPDRLGRAGVKKIGLGALHGLSDWRADAWFVGLHLRHLEATHWRTRYGVSFPRLRPHAGDQGARTAFGERDLVQAVCALRLFDPEIELALSTRESVAFRNHAFRLGFTAMSAGSKTTPGGYAKPTRALEQFSVDDDRSAAEVATFLRSAGWDPVWKDWDATYDGVRLGPREPARDEARG